MNPAQLNTLAVQALEVVVKASDDIDQHGRPYRSYEGSKSSRIEIQFKRGDSIPSWFDAGPHDGRNWRLYLAGVDGGLSASYKWIPEHDRIIAGEAACQKK